MDYRTLGRTGLRVSEVGLGGEWLDGKSAEEVCAVMDSAIHAGMNYIDIFMPEPNVRSNIGSALKGRREKMLIQGHIGTVYEDGQYKRTRDLSQTKEAFEDLLSRLQTDYVDVGMIHYVDSAEDYAAVFETEIIDYAKSLKAEGKIRFLGLSSHNPEIALRAVQTGLIDVLMFSINPAYDFEDSAADIYSQMEFSGLKADGVHRPDSARRELYGFCEAAGVGIVVMKALAGGRLLDASQSPFGTALTVPQCIHYSLTRPGVTSVLVGCSSVSEVETAAAYCSASDAKRDYSFVFAGNPQIQTAGNCMYCGHCRPCSAHIDIPVVFKLLDLALAAEEVPATVAEHYDSLEYNADDCIECHLCERNCPFGVKIAERMGYARRIFW